MTKVLGLDLGTNSIGWALVDTDKNELLNAGVRIFPNIKKPENRIILRQIRRHKFRLTKSISLSKAFSFDKKTIAFKALSVFTIATTFLAFINFSNWQFWLNISMTSCVALLTIIYQDKK
jgi:hypothetical protein